MNDYKIIQHLIHEKESLLEKLVMEVTGFTKEQIIHHRNCFLRVEWSRSTRSEIKFMNEPICWAKIEINESVARVVGGLS